MKTETFRDVEKLLWQLVNKYYAVYGSSLGTPDELFSEACLAFVEAYDTYDYDKGAFTTHVYWRVNGRLLTYQRQRRHRHSEVELNESEEARPDKLHSLIRDLSDDARILVSLVIDPPVGLRTCIGQKRSVKGIRAILRDYLDGLQWTTQRVETTFREIQEALSWG